MPFDETLVVLKFLVEDFVEVFQNRGSVLFLELAFRKGVVCLNGQTLPQKHGRFGILRDLVLRRSGDTVEHCQRHSFDLVLFRDLFELLLIRIRIVRQQNNKRCQLLVFVLFNCFVKLTDQTGQVVRNRSRENRGDGTSTVASAVAK